MIDFEDHSDDQRDVRASGRRGGAARGLPAGTLAELQRALAEDERLASAVQVVRPPYQLASFVQTLGAPGAFRLVERVGGERVFVARVMGARNTLARRCGLDVAKLLADVRGGEQVKVPAARPWRAAIWIAAGYSTRAVAAHLNYSESGVWRIGRDFGVAKVRAAA